MLLERAAQSRMYIVWLNSEMFPVWGDDPGRGVTEIFFFFRLFPCFGLEELGGFYQSEIIVFK